MRFVHISDTHIGYSAYTAIDRETGRNQREVDVENAFRQAVDRILDIKPDFVIHSGDLFHTVRPSNRAIGFAMEEIERITDAGIPFVVIAGNHSAPRMRETGSVFRIISKVNGVHAFYREKYEKMEIGDALLHLLPHVHGGERFREEAALMKALEGRINIAVLHSGVEGLRAFKYSTGEANEDLISMSEISEGFDYIAFGHFHEFTKLDERAYYSGSTERLSFTDAGQDKGFLVVETSPFSVDFVKLDIRPMIDLPPMDAKGKSASEIMNEIEEMAGPHLKDAIVRLRINNIGKGEHFSLDSKRIKKLFSDTMHFEMQVSQGEGGSAQVEMISLETMGSDFAEFIRKTSVEGLDKERLIKMGERYLALAIEEGER